MVAKPEGISSLSRARHRRLSPLDVEFGFAAVAAFFSLSKFIFDELGNVEVVNLGQTENRVSAE